MDIELIKQKKSEIVERYGPWTAHNIRLGNDVYTIDKKLVGDEVKLRCVLQIIADVAGQPFDNLRILDLACLEGLYAVELALQGADVVGIEGREANIEKARCAKDILALNNLELVQDDVRDLTKDRYGRFDGVLCMGILYHLDIPDVFSFVEAIAGVCVRFLIVDTEVTTTGERYYIHDGKKYWGKMRVEHSATSTPEERAASLWASLDNVRSFCLTRPSLYNLLSHVGFTSVYECHSPRVEKSYGRIMLVAIKGEREPLISAPLINTLSEENWPEGVGVFHKMVKISRLLPEQIKDAVLRMFAP